MYALLVIFAGLFVGGSSLYSDFKEIVAAYREELNLHKGWTTDNAKETVMSALGELEMGYDDYYQRKVRRTTDDVSLVIGQEYRMYSNINQKTSLRKDSAFVRFIKKDMGEWLFTVAYVADEKDCTKASQDAQKSLQGAYDLKTQTELLNVVKLKCSSE